MKRKTSYLQWDEYTRLLNILKGDKLRILIAFQGMCGLRVGDVLKLTWGDVIHSDTLTIIEEKTGKTRDVYMNESLIKIIMEEYNDYYDDVYIFRSKFGNCPISISYVNRKLKETFKKYKIKYSGNVSSHLFRKSFGRRYMDLNDWSDKSLLMLNEVYGHSTIKMTKIYLGIREEEIRGVYKTLTI